MIYGSMMSSTFLTWDRNRNDLMDTDVLITLAESWTSDSDTEAVVSSLSACASYTFRCQVAPARVVCGPTHACGILPVLLCTHSSAKRDSDHRTSHKIPALTRHSCQPLRFVISWGAGIEVLTKRVQYDPSY